MDPQRKARLQRLNANRAAQAGGGAEAPSTMQVLRAIETDPGLVMNALTTRSELLNKLFDPRRDIDEECGYPKTIGEAMYRAMYDRELGRRVVDVYPSETWKEFPRIYEDPDPDTNTPFEDSLEEVNNRHHLLHYLQRADELSGVGHYGVILWGLDDGKLLHEPVEGWEDWEETTGRPAAKPPAATTNRRILYIRVLDESLVTIADYEQDVTNPRYGLPNHYTITLSDPRRVESGAAASPPNTTETRVHWTRVTHIADNRKTSEVLGTPRMEPVWNRLYDLRKVLGGAGEMFWRGGFPGVSLETQPGLENAELDEEATARMMFDYMNGLQRYIALTGMSAKSLSPQISDPTSSFEVHIKAICVTLGVPYRVFMGIEEGVVSGDQATKAWEGRLANRQARYVTPMIINRVIQRLIDYRVLAPTAEPMGWEVEWPDLMAPSEADKAAVATTRTDALSKYVQGGVDALVPPLEYLTLICGFDDDTAQAIIDAAVQHIGEVDDDETITPGRLPTPPELQGVVPGEEPDDEEEVAEPDEEGTEGPTANHKVPPKGAGGGGKGGGGSKGGGFDPKGLKKGDKIVTDKGPVTVKRKVIAGVRDTKDQFHSWDSIKGKQKGTDPKRAAATAKKKKAKVAATKKRSRDAKKMTIDQASKALEKEGFKLGKARQPSAKTGWKAAYEVTMPNGTSKVMTAAEIKKLI